MKKLLGLVAVFAWLIFTFSCAKSASRESEPNNDFKTAMELRAGSPVEGFLDRAGDADFYRVTVSGPTVLDLQLTAVRGINHSIKIWNGATGELVKIIDDSRKSSPERMCNFRFGGGYLFVSVQHGEKDTPSGNLENSYQLRVDFRDPAEGFESEPNDTPENATPMAVIGEASGHYSPAVNRLNKSEKHPGREEDWFSIDLLLRDGKPLLLDLELSPVPDIDPELVVYGPGMREIMSAGGLGAGQGESLRGIGITESGVYHFLVAAENSLSNCDIPYVLSIKTRDYDFTGEMEPNNDPGLANVIQSGEMTGSLSAGKDRDFFMVKSGGELRVIRLEVVPSAELDLAFNVYDASKNRLYEINNSGKGEREILPNAAAKEDVYIEVLARGAVPVGDAGYRLLVSSKAPEEGFEIEPNNTRNEATRTQGDVVTGYSTRRNDVDYFLLEYGGRSRRRFTVNASKGARLKVSVTDPLGNAIRTITVDGGTEKKFYEMIDQKGYLIIKSLKENFFEPYVIQVKPE